VILSFENHCSVEQQKIVAQYLTEILGGILLVFLADRTTACSTIGYHSNS